MAWIELNWVVSRREIERCSVQLFALNALGVQEDFLPGEAPAQRQPWDIVPAPALPERALLKAWWPQADAELVRAQLAHLENAQWHSLAPADWGESQCFKSMDDQTLVFQVE